MKVAFNFNFFYLYKKHFYFLFKEYIFFISFFKNKLNMKRIQYVKYCINPFKFTE